ncbi:ATP-dependent helicase HrpB [Thermaurantiacus sp.]
MAEALPRLWAALDKGPNAVLVAPPGAGKTTAVPPSLLASAWRAGGRILLMLPRRLAARAAAERIAELAGGRLGEEVGYATRLESRTGPHVAIECLTEGLFQNRLLADPDLPGVAALLFDEVHERSLDADLGLALARDAQEAFRPELRILAMSATIDGARFAEALGGAPVIEAAGKAFPLEIRHRPGPPSERLESAMARGISEALAASTGSILAFLPGVAEIERTADALSLPASIALHRLHGSLPPAAQRAALKPTPGRKLILATAIAETSLTIDGVTAVVDSGLSRRPRFDRASGLTRLETGKASQASITQRAGRAARQAPGLAIRLWAEAETRGRIPFDPPEILVADLAPLALALARWGVSDPARLAFPDPPPEAALADARARLREFGALDDAGRITPHGQRLAGLPLSPPLAHMLVEAARGGEAELAARIALILSERGAGGQAVDLLERLRQLERGPPASRRLAERWARLVAAVAPTREPQGAARLLALAFPDRVARRRRPAGRDREAQYLMASGRGALLDAAEPLAAAEWLVVADAGGTGADSRIRLAVAFDDEIAGYAAAHATRVSDIRIEGDRVTAMEVERLGAITLARRPLAAPDPAEVARIVAAHLAGHGLDLPESEALELARLRYAEVQGFSGLPPLDDATLAEALVARSGPFRRLSDLNRTGFAASLVPPALRRALDRFVPATFETPAGSRHAIDYGREGGPEVEVRVQALFGLTRHPLVAGHVPLTLALTSPAGRVIAKTRDIAGFWKGGWAEVRRDLKGRYPKHDWPEDPLSAAPSLRAGGRRPA